MSENHGRFCWYDLMTTDTGAATGFYGAVFGWTTEAMDAGDPPYSMWKNRDVPFGGFLTLPEEARSAGAPPHWLAYINVDDVEASTARALELGATVHVPVTAIPEMGRFSILADPQAATIALWASAQPTEMPAGAAPVGQVSWHELATSDRKAAAGFYDELFGWTTIEEHDMGPMGIYRIFGKGQPAGGMFDRPAEMPVSCWLYYVAVADADATLAKIVEHGGSVVNGPMDVPGGDRIAQCADPQGTMFAIHERRAG